jgi:hypothetical protein
MEKTNLRSRGLRRLPAMLAGIAVIAASLLAVSVPASAATGMGIGGDGKIPSDGSIAVGTSDIVQVENSEIGIWSKTNTTTPLVQESIQAFQGPAATDNNCGDPQILYMPLSQRWAFSCTESSGISLAVSQTSDPTGNWYSWVGQAGTGMPFGDGPKLLVTSDKLLIYTSGNPDDIIHVYPLASLLAGTMTTPVTLDVGYAFPHTSAVYQNAASVQAAAYFVGNGCTPSNCGFDLVTVSGPPSSPQINDTFLGADTATAVPSSPPPIPGGAIDQALPGDGVISAVMENRTSDGHAVIAFSGEQGCPSDPNSYCVYRDVYDLTAGTLSQGYSGQPGYDDEIYGSVGIDAQGNLFDSYTSVSPTQAPSAGAAGPNWNAEMAATTTATTDSSERWGDSYEAAQDPSDGSKVWFVSDYQTGTSEADWATAIGCGTAAGYGCSQTPALGAPQVLYADYNPAQTTNSIQPDITLDAQGAPVNLSQVTVRYWFTRDSGADSFNATCQYAQVGCSNVTESVVNLSQPVNGADSYLQVGFTAGAGQLGAFRSSSIQLFLNKTDWSNFNQANDYSYLPSTTPTTTTAITVYINGQLVWGLEP